MTEDNFVVYKHSSPSGKVYIGQTCQKPEHRWSNGKAYKNCSYFYHAIQKYGWDNFIHEIVADGLTKEEACDLEKFLIWRFNSTNPEKGYNLSLGGDCSGLGVVHSEESRKKSSESNKRTWSDEVLRKKHGVISKSLWCDAEYRKKTVENMTLVKRTTKYRMEQSERSKSLWCNPEYRKKVTASKQGEKHPMYGKHHTEESRKKISEASKRMWENPDFRKKVNEVISKPVECIETGEIFSSATEAAKKIGLKSATGIGECCRGQQKTAGGFHWRFCR